jgi:4-carboxymuconolactone decarboxylase
MQDKTTSPHSAASPAPAPDSRVPLPAVEHMSAQQRQMYDSTIAFLGGPYGPRMALINVPDIARPWGELQRAITAHGLAPRLFELTILVVAREWDSQFEWWAHAEKAAKAGVPGEVIESIRQRQTPRFAADDERAAYEYLIELLRHHDVGDATYERLRALIGSDGVVALTALAGHYCNVAMTLAAHRVALPPGVAPPLDPRGADTSATTAPPAPSRQR